MKKIIAIVLILIMLLSVGCSNSDDTSDLASDDEITRIEQPEPNRNNTSEILRTYDYNYTVVDTMQSACYDNDGNEIVSPNEGDALYGQDAQYNGVQAAYVDNGDGTITDLNTGLMWQQTPDYTRYGFDEAIAYCEDLILGNYDDWRLPTIKELYSLANFNGALIESSPDDSVPYIDTDYFDFKYDTMMYAGQYWSNTKYTKGGLQGLALEGAFGFNFADGHIKAYETGYYFDGSVYEGDIPGCYVRAVRSVDVNHIYGENQFVNNGDGTVTDLATGLTWQSANDGITRNWEEALAYAEKLGLAGYDDWRLPNAKELQSIIDYYKETLPAIDERFFTLSDPDGWFFTSTTHGDNKNTAVYLSFGKAYSTIDGENYYDWHGAGALRSDPKSGDPSDYEMVSENAEDLVRIYNYTLCVRDNIQTTKAISESSSAKETNPSPSNEETVSATPTDESRPAPVSEDAAAKPANDELVSEPANDETVSEPATEETLPEPPSEETRPEPPSDAEISEPSTEEETSEPTTDEEANEPSDGEMPPPNNEGEGDLSSLLDEFVTDGVLTDSEAEALAEYLTDNEPSPGSDPLDGAVEAGIITQDQADEIELPKPQGMRQR